MMNRPNRRHPSEEKHVVRVIATGAPEAPLGVSCVCGARIPLRRTPDTKFVTMSDLLELFRMHITDVEYGGRGGR